MQIVSADALRRLLRDLLEAAGTAAEAARLIGDSLVDANLAGHDSHGAIRILHYLEVVQTGAVDPRVEPEVVRRDRATATIDAKWGWGQPAMWLATRTACELAREHGLGAVVVTNSYHIGRVAPYVEWLATEGMIGLAMANAGRAVAPFGSRQRVMGTNPIAWAAPRAGDAAPVCLDVATAAVAEGKLRVARARGVAAPAGAVIDTDGLPSVNPNDFYEGGALLPFGAHKGSGLSILAQLVGVGLAGAHPDVLSRRRGANGPLVIALDVSAFVPLETFTARVEEQCAEIASAEPAAGVERVYLPGEPELGVRAARERMGIPLPDSTWAELCALAEAGGVSTECGARWQEDV